MGKFLLVQVKSTDLAWISGKSSFSTCPEELEEMLSIYATYDLLSGTIFVFDTDTQVCGQSRKQQMLHLQGANIGICPLDPTSVAFSLNING